MTNEIESAAKHWDEYTRKYAGRRTGLYWYELPGVMNHINLRISGRPDVDWIEYTVKKHLPMARVARCLSLGCGTGQLERSLARLNAFESCDAYDVSEESIAMARKLADAEGFGHINYQVADVNRLELPEDHYDAAWLYGSLHHLGALEEVLGRLRRSLKPDGLLAFNEYVGPARFQFPERQKEIANLCLKLLPLRYRRVVDEALELDRERVRRTASENQPADSAETGWSRIAKWLRPGGGNRPDDPAPQTEPTGREPVYREAVGFPAVEDVIADDPSESVRSDQILPILRQHFEIVEQTNWGGNLPQFLLSGIAGNFHDDDPCAQALLEMIWKIDATLLACGEFETDFAYVAARPRPPDLSAAPAD